jgi:TnpA family transposase
MAAIWGDGTTSSSDGQYFRAGGRAGPGGAINAKYGIDSGAVLYTHVSGQYGPFYTRVLAATMSEAPYVLDGLHHHAHQRQATPCADRSSSTVKAKSAIGPSRTRASGHPA